MTSARTPRRSGETTSRPAAPPELSGPVEDYLKAIYDIGRDAGSAATNDIAQRLSIAPASVSGMVRRLAEQGLVAYERYRGARLTALGRRAALRTLRRHRVIESYLAEALGYPWDRVHAEAERLEHAASEELIDRMAAAIGEPEVDPHGAPIPTREGAVDETRHLPLTELPVGASARIMRVGDDDAALLRYLSELELLPGTVVALAARAPFGGPLTLIVNGARCVIGAELAAQLRVSPGRTRPARDPRPRRATK